MKIRDWANQNSAVVTIGAVVLLLVALGAIVFQMRPRTYARVVSVYYYDLNTGKTFVGPSDKMPPIPAPSGPLEGMGGDAGVRAYVFACGDCSDESKRFVGWLEIYTPDAKEAMQNAMRPPAGGATPAGGAVPPGPMGSPDMFMLMEEGHLIRAEKAEDGSEPKWEKYNSEAGFKIIQSIQTRCEGAPPKPCFPGR